jgi:AbrB family looped-hinge helix DNA binding protein
MSENLPGTKLAEKLVTRPDGATMDELIAATGGPQYNVLRKLQNYGYQIRKAKEGNATRYFATPPTALSYEATVTSKGQVTIPKAVRMRLGLRDGGKVRFELPADGAVVLKQAELSIRRLFGILGKPRRSATIEQMNDAVRSAAVARYLRAVGGTKR